MTTAEKTILEMLENGPMTQKQIIAELAERLGDSNDDANHPAEAFDFQEMIRAKQIRKLSDGRLGLVPHSRKCTSCGAELGSDWDAATVHIDHESGVTCGGKIQ